jgi:hypothetical protein
MKVLKPHPGGTRSVTVAHRKLAHRETKKVKANIAFMRGKCVGDAGLGCLEIQSYLCQPCFGSCFELEQRRQIFVKNHKVVGVANDGWFAGFGE